MSTSYYPFFGYGIYIKVPLIKQNRPSCPHTTTRDGHTFCPTCGKRVQMTVSYTPSDDRIKKMIDDYIDYRNTEDWETQEDELDRQGFLKFTNGQKPYIFISDDYYEYPTEIMVFGFFFTSSREYKTAIVPPDVFSPIQSQLEELEQLVYTFLKQYELHDSFLMTWMCGIRRT